MVSLTFTATFTNSSLAVNQLDASAHSETYDVVFGKAFKGDAGVGVSSLIPFFYATETSTAPSAALVIAASQHITPSDYGSNKPYLWKLERTVMSDGTLLDSAVVLVSKCGTDGGMLWPIVSLTQRMHVNVDTQESTSTDRFSVDNGHLKITF